MGIRELITIVASGLTVSLALCGCTHPGLHRQPEATRVAAAVYEKLLAMYPEESQGLGADDHFRLSPPEHQPMTYGLILTSEALRFRRTGADECRRRIRKATDWLVANADLDRDGKPGWGLPQAWDAFQDGSVNPRNQPYTITTAIVLNGMLDALADRSLCSQAESEQIVRLVSQVVLRWCREVWSDGYGGGFFWYSPNPADAIFAVNTPSMFLGSIVRLIHEYPEALSAEERRLIENRADALARAIVNTAELRNGSPFWDYMAWPNFRNVRRPNDLVHHVYTLMGIETYRDCGGRVRLPWTRLGSLRSLDSFWADGQIRQFPQGIQYAGAQSSLGSQPAILWGTGAMLAGYACWADWDGASRVLTAIQRDYGPIPDLRLRPEADNSDPTFYPRQAAHVLWGLALYAHGSGGD